MDYINPIFSNSNITKETPKVSKQSNINKPKVKRATRKDKQHNIKFPVSPMLQMKLKSTFRQAKRLYQIKGREELKQTKFNTALLRYGLEHKEIIRWDHEYKDTRVYMHTSLLETEYEGEIGGPHGLAIQKNLSERKVVYQIIISVLKWIEGGGSIEEIL